MQLTDVALVNMAIARLGEGKPIASLNDGSQEATWAATFLPLAKKVLLSSHAWSFARRSAALVAAVVDAVPTGWTYAYQVPADMVAAREIWNGLRRSLPSARVPFEQVFATSNAGATRLQVLVTDVSPATLIYTTGALTEADDFPVPYLDALAFGVAAELAMPLAKRPELVSAMRQAAEYYRRRAVAFDMNTRGRDQEPDPESLTSRL